MRRSRKKVNTFTTSDMLSQVQKMYYFNDAVALFCLIKFVIKSLAIYRDKGKWFLADS